jgi:6-phosphogluconolactonase
MRVVVGDDLAELGADWIAQRAEGQAQFAISLAGGSTPKGVYERLATLPLAWETWHVWWGDERMVQPDHADSNERMAREALLDRVGIPESQITPLRGLDTPLPTQFDVVLLGIGTDGHTASLFPNDAGLDATAPIVQVDRPDHPRLSITYPVINAAKCAVFLASGEGKREIVKRVIERDPALPASHVQAGETVVLADRTALEGEGEASSS